MKGYIKIIGATLVALFLLCFAGIYLYQMNKRGGFESIPDNTPVPSLRITKESNILQPIGSSFSFAVLGDMRWTSEPRIAVLTDAQKRGPLFTANLGDPVEFAGKKEWQRYIVELSTYWNPAMPYFHIPGGHSLNFRINGIYPAFFEHYFGRTYYFLDANNWRFIFLDTSKTYLPLSQRRWLSHLLAECKREEKRAVIFTHCPPRAAEQGVAHALTKGSTNALAQIISDHDVAAIFAGHIHETFSYLWKGIPVYVTSLNEATWTDNNFAEYLYVILRDKKLTVETISLSKSK